MPGESPTPPTRSWLRLARRTRQQVQILPVLAPLCVATMRTCSLALFVGEPAAMPPSRPQARVLAGTAADRVSAFSR